MTSNFDSQVFESYVPVYDVAPEKWEDARPFIVEQLRKLATAVNIREIGWLLDEELLSGKAFIPGSNNVLDGGTSQTFRQVLRKVVDFGALPNAGLKSVPHGIIFDANFTLLFLGGYATDPVNFVALPLPFANPTAQNLSIALTMDATNINVVTGVDRTAFTSCFVIIEYTQEL